MAGKPKIDFAKIELLVLDVDGVMTDGGITLTPAGEEIKTFHSRDGAGVRYWRRAGGRVAFLTGRASRAVELRAKDLDVDAVRLGVKNKLPAYLEILREMKCSPEQAAVVGDDLPELPLMRKCGFPVAVADAASEVIAAAAYVTKTPGGRGAVREVIELILRGSGKWDKLLERYVQEGDTKPA